jgi:ABC-type transport system substrate-binding protein
VLPALFSLDAASKPAPELAAAWPERDAITFDPFTVTIDLRRAEWSDGKAITSGDVRFSWTKLRVGPTGYRYRFLREVETPSARQVRLRFDRPVRRWWALFSVDDMVLPAHAYSERWAREPTVSGGPFTIAGWTDGLKIVLRRNERYWGRAPPLAGIDVLFVPDVETRLQLLERDEIDAFFAEGDTNLGRRARAYGSETIDGPLAGDGGASGAWGPTWWELDLDPQRLRLPVARAVLETAGTTLAAEILEDSGRRANTIPPQLNPRREDVPEPWRARGDLDAATRVLDAGGIPSGNRRAEFQLAFAGDGTAGALAAFIHFRLREIGVTAELVGLEYDTFERSWVPERRAPAVLRLRRGADAADVASYTSAARLPGSSAIDDQVADAESDVPPERLAAGPVTGVDADAWLAAQRKLAEAAAVTPLAAVRTWVVAADGIWGPHATGTASGPLWNTAAWSVQRD